MPANSSEYMREYMKKYLKNKKNREENRARKRARRKMEKAGRVRPNDGKEVDHKKGMSGGNGKKNLRVLSKSENRRRGVKKAIAARKRRKANGGKY